MGWIRNLLESRPRAAAFIVALALAMKIVVPGGFMLGEAGSRLTVEICDGHGGLAISAITIPTRSDGGHDDQGHAAKECPYTALTMASLASAGAVFVALAIAFALMLGFAARTPPAVARRAFDTPPLRAPPAIA
jgi:hypothetical protein